jgi:hypothetical protein
MIGGFEVAVWEKKGERPQDNETKAQHQRKWLAT